MMRWQTTIPLLLGATSLLALALLWRNAGNVVAAPLRLPGQDRAAGTSSASTVDLRGELLGAVPNPVPPPQLTDAISASSPGWPTFRGPDHTAINRESIPLDTTLKHAKICWQVALGEGYAGPAIAAGKLYVLDYDAPKSADVLRCLAVENGEDLWRRSYKVDIKRNHGMSRTVPAVSPPLPGPDGTPHRYVVTLGPKAHILCLDAANGDFIWGQDLTDEYGTKVPPWYAGQCPLIDNDSTATPRLILAPAGEKTLITALDLATGKPIWETPNPRGWTMTHVSILPLTFEGRRMYIYCGSAGVAGVDAATGQLLWETFAWKVNIATVPTPVDLGTGRILFTGGYGAGAMIGQLVSSTPTGGTTQPALPYRLDVVQRFAPSDLGAEQQTPIFRDNLIFAILPGGGQLVCLDRTGQPRWRSSTTGGGGRYGLGPYLLSPDALWILNDTGTLTAIAPKPDKFTVLGEKKIIVKAAECWGPMALVDGRLFARDLTHLVCIDLRQPERL